MVRVMQQEDASQEEKTCSLNGQWGEASTELEDKKSRQGEF